MTLTACPVPGKKKSADICTAFIKGAPKAAEGCVFFGVTDGNLADWVRVLRRRIPFYYIDNSYFDSVRGTQFRVTRNRLQIEAGAHDSDGQRFNALGLGIKPIQVNSDGHWVLVEQSPLFMRLLAAAPDWSYHQEMWAHRTGRRVVVRRWSSDKPKVQTTLKQDLEGAWGLHTHSSAAAVTALLEGITAYVEPMSAVANLQLSSDNSVDDRRRFFNVLADNQFTLDEMREGKAWALLDK